MAACSVSGGVWVHVCSGGSSSNVPFTYKEHCVPYKCSNDRLDRGYSLAVAIFFASYHGLKATLATMWTMIALVMATACVWSRPRCKRGKTKHFWERGLWLEQVKTFFLRWTLSLRDKPEECGHGAREVVCVTWTWPGFVYSKPRYCLIDMWGVFDLILLTSQRLPLSSLVFGNINKQSWESSIMFFFSSWELNWWVRFDGRSLFSFDYLRGTFIPCGDCSNPEDIFLPLADWDQCSFVV